MFTGWLSRSAPHSGARIRAAGWALVTIMAAFQAAEADPVKIMPLGDSITRGTNDINYPNGDIPGGYRRELGNLLAAAQIDHDFIGDRSDNAAPGMDPDHNGNNGYRTDEILAILPSLLGADPDVVLLMAGTNDMLQAVPVATAVNHLRNLIVQITSDDPDRKLWVATIPPITQNWNGQSAAVLNANANLYNAEVRNLIAEYASQGRKVALADMNAGIVLTDEDPLKNFFQPGDGVHPGQAGYDQLGGLWFETITAGGPLIDVPKTGLPTKPSGLSLSVVSPSRINLTWTDAAINESAYRVYSRTLPTGLWQEIAALPAGADQHPVTGLTNGLESYGFAVAAVNANGESPWSEVVISPSPEDRAHLKPASASSIYSPAYAASKGNDGKHDTIWASGGGSNHYWQVDLQDEHHLQQLKFVTRQDNDVADHRRNFQIRVSNDPTFAIYQVVATQGATALPFKAVLTQSPLSLDGYRYVRVVKTDASSFAFSLLQAYGTEETSAPATPAALAVTGSGDTWVRLAWQPVSGNENGFRLERKTGASGTFSQIATVAADAVSYLDASVAAGTGYVYRIAAVNESGVSPFGDEVSATTSTLDGYQSWSASFPEFASLPANEQLPGADANGDGWPNLLAYAAGLDPMSALVSSQLAGLETQSSGEWYFRYRRNKNAVDLTYQVLSCDSPGGSAWSVVNESAASVSDVPGEPGVEEVRVPVIPSNGQTRLFFRLKVAQP
jgi:lysophospholipase L1-like esterase